MTRFMYVLALAASVILAAGAATAAGGGTRPDDRATHGPGSIGIAQTTAPIRPDDRAWRGVGPAPTVEIVRSPSLRVDGFDWSDAGIGAAAAFGLGLFVVGASALVRRRQRMAAVS